MNWSEMKADWPVLKSLVRTHWPRLTEEDVSRADVDRGALARTLERVYGLGAEEVEAALLPTGIVPTTPRLRQPGFATGCRIMARLPTAAKLRHSPFARPATHPARDGLRC